MALTTDQRALLQLVCERGQSYSDLAALLGISEDEVRARARSALTELGGADPDADVQLTDYLLGQADPIGRADAARFLQQDAATRELAAEIATKLEVIAPKARLPKIPEGRGGRRKPAAAAGAEPPRRGGGGEAPAPASAVSRSSRQARIIAAIGAAALLLLFAVLALAGVFSGDDRSAAGSAAEQAPATVRVPLEPAQGSGVAGQAEFGIGEENGYVDLEVQGLDPSPGSDRVYLLWAMISGQAGIPLPTPIVPTPNGTYNDRIEIPAEQLEVVASARSVDLVLSPARKLGDEITEAVEAGSPVLGREGEPVARGMIADAEASGAAQSQSGSGSG